MSDRGIKAKKRNKQYAEKYSTKIWSEENSSENPFIESSVACFGYDLEELANNISYTEMIFLMIQGELPTKDQIRFANKLFVYFSHPGLRSEAVRASILAGVGRTIPEHVLPIGLLVYGGERTGVSVVDGYMKFIIENQCNDPLDFTEIGADLGFKEYYGGVDIMAEKICQSLLKDEMKTPSLDWIMKIQQSLSAKGCCNGMSKPLVAAAALCDLGIAPKHSVTMLQFIACPGLFAQGLEHANKPATVLPFVSDENYELTCE